MTESGGVRPTLHLAVVTCYRHPDYVRARTLRRAAEESGRFGTITVVKNRSVGVARYGQVIAQLLRLRGQRRPDAYLVTFRGYEILPFVLLLAGRRPVYYDEFINPVEWFVHEHHKFRESSLRARLLRGVFRRLMRRCAAVLADTESHADYSSQLMAIDRSRYTAVPVGSDDAVFSPVHGYPSGDALRVLYYGSMLPLHGLGTVLGAAVAVRDEPRISLVLVGGDAKSRIEIEAARHAGAQIEYLPWVDFEKLPALFASCGLMLGGPFGATLQSEFVITGKTFQFLASALPVVVGENRESAVFTDRVNAVVVKQGDAEALADAWRWALKNSAALPEIGRRGRTLYEEEFSSARLAERLARAFDE